MDKPKNIQSFKKPERAETMDDPFPRRPDRDRLDDKVELKEIQHILQRVMQCLMAKALHSGIKADKYNQTYLGGVSFYVDHNDVTQQTRLMFDKHPSTWRENEVIKDATNLEADIMMEKQAQDDMYDNPFTY